MVDAPGVEPKSASGSRDEVPDRDVAEDKRNDHEAIFKQDMTKWEARVLMTIALVVVCEQSSCDREIVQNQKNDDASI